MKVLFASLLILSVVACSRVTDDTPGQIFQVSNTEVKMVGPKAHGRQAIPTKRMVAQAQEVCPSASFHSALPSMSVSDQWEYLFKC